MAVLEAGDMRLRKLGTLPRSPCLQNKRDGAHDPDPGHSRPMSGHGEPILVRSLLIVADGVLGPGLDLLAGTSGSCGAPAR